MRKTLRPEERKWTVGKKGMPLTEKKERKCKYCKKVLSKFNLTQYCFIHQNVRVKKYDAINDKERAEQAIFYRRMRNAKTR